MIQLQIITVNRKSSSQVSTVTYTDKGPQKTPGAEWEEVEFIVKEKESNIQVGNIRGDALLLTPAKLIINNPKLFGILKVNDLIPFAALIEATSTT